MRSRDERQIRMEPGRERPEGGWECRARLPEAPERGRRDVPLSVVVLAVPGSRLRAAGTTASLCRGRRDGAVRA